MCGIAGILLSHRSNDTDRLRLIDPMTGSMRHRGPDGADCWVEKDAGIALGHRRLAIVDLSPLGRQPMRSHSGRYIISYNGEIYNFPDLRKTLEGLGRRFAGGSDTEVLLAAIEVWGIEAALQRCTGMFALGLWDTMTRTLHLARDRIGKKPLYIGMAGKTLLFASELKAFNVFPDFRRELDQASAGEMLISGWVPDHMCIWKDAFKLAPGGLLSLSADDLDRASGAADLQKRTRIWWSLGAIAADGRNSLFQESEETLVSQLDELLRLAVRQRMVADVPVGAFLSGGIDSSAVAALMQAQSARPVRTFTISFGDKAFDESAHAAEVAHHLGADHTELHLTPDAARDVIPSLPKIWDEPFGDESQIPTYLVSKLARAHVTVALSGDGGDECFGGYARHYALGSIRRVQQLHPSLRGALSALAGSMTGGAARSILDRVPMGGRMRHALRSDRLRRLSLLLDTNNEDQLVNKLIRGNSPIFGNPGAAPSRPAPDFGDLVSRVIYEDMSGYLPGDILVKLDRAAMANSLEGRCPLLDHRVIEFSWRLPTAMKVRDGRGKWILRQVLRRYVPDDLIDRPKQGFDVPVASWLRGPLREWASDLLADLSSDNAGLTDAVKVKHCWSEHVSGRADLSRELWPLLMFQSWRREAMGVSAGQNAIPHQYAMTGA